jgi:hypothetical protein
MRFSGYAIMLPKADAAPGEIEDAAAGPVTVQRDTRAAVADGAGESAFSRHWAEMLVKAYVDIGGDLFDEDSNHPENLRKRWKEDVARQLSTPQWYLQAKVDQGAFAAFLGIEIEPDGRYRALASGDCVLFLIRSGDMVDKWPYQAASEMPSRPTLLSSSTPIGAEVMKSAVGWAHCGDRFLLATDAMAAYILGEGVDWMNDLDRSEVEREIAKRRGEKAIRHDDITLLILEALE